jgi:hypothetical protein
VDWLSVHLLHELLLLFILTANGILPGGNGTTIRYNTQIHISHKITHTAQNTAYKATQTITDMLNTVHMM